MKKNAEGIVHPIKETTEEQSEAVARKTAQVKFSGNSDGIHYRGLGDVQLGDGVDIQQGKIKFTDVDDTKMLIDGKPGFKTGSSTYEDFAKFHAGKSSEQSASKWEAHGGASVSYGLVRASAKYSHEEQNAQAQDTGTITKTVGMVRKRSYYLPYDYGEGDNNETARSKSAELVLAGSEAVSEWIQQIRAAEGNDKIGLINGFYKEYGTHVVSSVTKGYIGYFNMFLKFTGSQKKSSTGNAGSASVGYVGLTSVEGGFSMADSDSFSTESWEYESQTYAHPDSTETLNSLKAIKGEVDATVQAAQDKFNFGNVKIDASELNYPTLPDAPKIPEADKEASKELATTKKQMKKDLGTLKTKTSDYQKLQKSDPEGNKQKMLEIVKEMSAILEKFDTYGDYSSFSLSDDEAATVKSARAICDGADLSPTELQNKLDQIEKEKQEQKEQREKEKEDQVLFSAWLKKYHQENYANEGWSASFSNWFDTLTAADIAKYKDMWKKEVDLTRISSELKAPQMKKNVAGKKQAHLLKSAEEENKDVNPFTELATLDYNIVPWSEIFPELNFRLSDNSMDLIKIKLYEQLNDYLGDLEYLNLVCEKLNDTADLTDLLYQDEEKTTEIKGLYDNLVDTEAKDLSSNNEKVTISFNGKDYDISDSDSLSSLTKAIDTLTNATAMKKSAWYGVVKRLKAEGLLHPCGVMLAARPKGSGNAKTWELEYGGAGTINAMGERYFGGHTRSGYPYRGDGSSKSFGRQVAAYSSKDTSKWNSYSSSLCSVLPLVSNNSKVSKDWATNIYFLNEMGRDINASYFEGTHKIDSNNKPQSIYLKNDNLKDGKPNDNEGVFKVKSTERDDLKWNKRIKTGSDRYQDYFNNHKLAESSRVESLYKGDINEIEFSLVPMTSYIMKDYDKASKNAQTMNVYYTSGRNLPGRLYMQLFGEK